MLSHFSMLDGVIVGIYLLGTMIAGLWVRKFVGKVEHFLVAGREMNLYLGIASLAATEFGVITCMYTAQNGYQSGFAGAIPGILYAAAMLLVGLTGFCIKPLRNAGVTTIPELLERQFGTRIRWMSGVVIFLGGLLNMGVFLRIGGEFLVHSCGLKPEHLVATMAALLICVAIYTILGGMLSVLVTDYLQFIVMSLGLIVVTFLILRDVGWSRLVGAVQSHYGAGGFNPLRNAKLGWPFVIFNAMQNGAAVLTWQTTIARVLAAKDTKTGQRVYTGTSFFFVCRFMIPGVWGIAALATLPYVAGADSLYAMPRFLATHVPMGLMGLLIAAMLAADMSTDSSYMLTWGSILYNDIFGPFRKTRWSEKRGILWNRMIVAGIGIFLLVFGLLYPLPNNVWDYITITGTVYLASISVLLIACCYWKRANSWGAAGAIALGAIIPLAFLVMQQIEATKPLTEKIGPHYSGIAAFACAGLAMVIGSLLKPAQPRAQGRI